MFGPGAGTEPLAPQIFSFIVTVSSPTSLLPLGLVPPEEAHRAPLAIVGDDRQRGDVDLVRAPLHGSNREVADRGEALAQRPRGRQLLIRDGFAVGIEGAEGLAPFLGRHPPGLLEWDPEQGPGRLVVEEE